VKRIAIVAAALVLLSVSCSLAGSETAITGTYVNKADKEYLTLNADGSFYIKLRKKPVDFADPFLSTYGIYRMNGDEVMLELEGGGEASGSIKGSTFVDNEGKIWVKEGTSTPPPMEVSPKKGLRK
jgi:hypothetical protein